MHSIPDMYWIFDNFALMDGPKKICASKVKSIFLQQTT